jgi:O-antigen/teichoic acid export membrane protein
MAGTGEGAGDAAASRFDTTHFSSQFGLLLSTGLVNFIGGVVLNLVLARALGADGLGTWVVAFAIMSFIAGLSLLGADWIVLRQGSYYEGIADFPRLRATLHFSLLISAVGLLAVGAIVYACARLIAVLLLHDRSFEPFVRLAAIGGPIAGTRQVMLFASQTFKDVRIVSLIANILQPLCYLGFIGVALMLLGTTLAVFAATVLAEMVLTVAAVAAVNRRLRLIGPTESIDRRSLMRFAFPAWGSSIVETVRGNAFALLLGSSTVVSSVALFDVGDRVSQAATAINTAMNRIYTPIGSDLFLRDRHEELAALTKNVGRWTFTLTFPVVCMMIVFPREILSVFGPFFLRGTSLMMLLGVGVLFLCATGPVTQTLMIAGRARMNLTNYAAVVTIEVTTALLLIPRIGVAGAGIALLLGRFVNNVVPLVEVWAITGIHPYRIDYWKPCLAGVAAVGAAKTLVATLSIGGATAAAMGIAATGTVYVGLLLFFRLSDEDRAALAGLLGGLSGRRRATQGMYR